MSGLDPLGRRDVRALILELRDQGRTVFFSSHILADAEALCSRVAVVAGGRLAAAGRLTDILAFQVRGWELVVADLQPEVLARIARAAAEEHRDLAGALRARAAARRRTGAAARGADGDRRDARLAQPAARHARGLLRRGASPKWATGARAATPGQEPMRAISSVAVNVFKESVRDRVPYNLALFAVLLIAVLVPARPADGRAGRQDHQGPRPRRDGGVRPVHRHLHRHRPGVEGSRAAQHLLAAREADQPRRSSSPASTPGWC